MVDQIHVRGEGRSSFKLDLPLHETIEDQLRKGTLVRINEDGTVFTQVDDSVPAPPTETPKVSESKVIWVGWAVAQGCSADDAEAMTKADLIEKYGE